jgi:hypothetical protein
MEFVKRHRHLCCIAALESRPLPNRPSYPPRASLLAFAAAMAVSACTTAGEGTVPNPVRGLAETTGFATTPPPPADFVRSTRRPDATYLPVGVTPPPREIAPKSPDEIKAMESDLDSTLNTHSAISGKPRPKADYRSAATNPNPTPSDPSGGGRFLVAPREQAPAQKPSASKPQTR